MTLFLELLTIAEGDPSTTVTRNGEGSIAYRDQAQESPRLRSLASTSRLVRVYPERFAAEHDLLRRSCSRGGHTYGAEWPMILEAARRTGGWYKAGGMSVTSRA